MMGGSVGSVAIPCSATWRYSWGDISRLRRCVQRCWAAAMQDAGGGGQVDEQTGERFPILDLERWSEGWTYARGLKRVTGAVEVEGMTVVLLQGRDSGQSRRETPGGGASLGMGSGTHKGLVSSHEPKRAKGEARTKLRWGPRDDAGGSASPAPFTAPTPTAPSVPLSQTPQTPALPAVLCPLLAPAARWLPAVARCCPHDKQGTATSAPGANPV